MNGIKTAHRLCAIAALFLMLWMGLSGLIMQGADLWGILTHQRGNTPTVLATNEGKFGSGNFAVISLADYDSMPLPQNLDYQRALSNGYAGLRHQSPGTLPRFAEVRMTGSTVSDRFATGSLVRHGISVSQPVATFDALNGSEMMTDPIPPIGPPLPPSLRSTGLEFHRFFSHGAGVGVWLMLLSGVVIWVMLITGLSFYFKMLKARRRLKRRHLFWKAGGWWRTLHRGVSVGAAAFLILIAFSGTWMALESVYHSFRFVPEDDVSTPLDEPHALRMATSTLSAFRADHPGELLGVLRVRIFDGVPQGVVVTSGAAATQLVYNTDTGKRQSLTEAGYPASRFPFGDQVHQSMKRFHSGSDYGIVARLLSLLSGAALVYLAVSGLILYLTMWQARRRSGRPSFIWA